MKKQYPDSVINYLKKKTFNSWHLEWQEVDGIELVIVVPSICEYENIKLLLGLLARNSKPVLEKSLIIFVINNSISSISEIKTDNIRSIEYLRKLIMKDFSDEASKNISESGIRIGLIDASSDKKEFPDKIAGVGLARKIGMDSSLQAFDYSASGRKVIICLDADCIIEENYLEEIQNTFSKPNCFAAIVDFEHSFPEDEIKRTGILSYEIFLRHYIAGLLLAGSCFSFHTIGSTISCDYEAYIKVGGMNTKKAAEDFYFLQKLNKNFNIHRIIKTKVKPSARESWRVPFGTGRSMMDLSSNKKEILIFDPDIYLILKDWLKLYNSDLIYDPKNLLLESKKIHPELYSFLSKRNFTQDWSNILQNSITKKQLDYQRKNWFDAFVTLKFIHHLRDASFPMTNIPTGMEKLFNVAGYSAKFDSVNEIKNREDKLKFYLTELKWLENKLYNNQ